MPAFDVARRWKGRVVLDRVGIKLGSVLDVFYDAENDEPGWVLLGTDGDAGTRLVPVAEAVEHGNELRVPWDRAVVEGAPASSRAAGCGPRRRTRRTRRRPPWPTCGGCRPAGGARTPACGC
jgi:hypothetical protein